MTEATAAVESGYPPEPMPITYLEASRSMPLVTLPLRTSVAPLSGARVLIAPASTLSVERYRELAVDGEITDIVVPNLFHTEGVVPAAKAFPSARLWAPPGIEKKGLGVAWHGALGRDAWPHQDELALVALGGMPGFHESVFVHRATRTLVVTDLAFNLLDASGLGARILYGIFGTYRRFGVSRLFLRAVKDRRAFTRSLAELFEHDFDALAPSHGLVVERGAKEALREALAERGCAL